MAEEQPTTPPEVTSVVGPTGEFGPDSFLLDNKRKRKMPKKMSEASKKKVRRKLTLELPKSEGTVRFDGIVLVKVGDKQKMVLLKGYSSPNSTFYKKRRLQKLNMHLKHLNRAMTPRRLKIQQHVRDMLFKVNSDLVL